MVKTVIFDRDGVLLDSEFTNVRTAKLVFAEMGIQITAEEKRHIVGRHPDDYLVRFLERYSFDPAAFKARQRVVYYEVLEDTPAFERMLTLARELHERAVPVALCTSGSRSGTERVLDMLGIRQLFTVIVTKDDYTKRKPDPEPYEVTARLLGVRPEECVVIEDSAVGVKSAIAAGMKCVAVPNDYTNDHRFDGAVLVLGSNEGISADGILSL